MHKFFYIMLVPLALCPGCQHQEKAKKKSIANTYLEQSAFEAEEHNYKKALQLINKSLAAQETPQAIALKATLLYHLKNFDESLALFEKLMTFHTASATLRADAKNNYACVLNQLGYKEKAAQLWKELTDDINYLTPEVAHFNLGLLALGTGDSSQAEERLTRATNLAPDYVDAYFYLGMLFMQQHHWQKAREKFETVRSFASDHKPAIAMLKQLDVYASDQDDALNTLKYPHNFPVQAISDSEAA